MGRGSMLRGGDSGGWGTGMELSSVHVVDQLNILKKLSTSETYSDDVQRER